ncbi:Pentatricopeptide repeat-containing protein At1g04840 [Linum grandiflorum]
MYVPMNEMKSLLTKTNAITTKSQVKQLLNHPASAITNKYEANQLLAQIHASTTVLHLRQIHAQVFLQGFSNNSHLATQLVSSSSLRKAIDYSISVFCYFHPKNIFLFNALIRGLERNARYDTALSHFVLMLKSDIRPDRMTYPFVLKATAQLFFTRLAAELHCMIFKCGVEFDSFVRVSLADMYVKVEELESALKVFDECPQRFDGGGTLLWNVLINGCCKVGNMGKAMELFNTMPGRDVGSWNSLINGFLRAGELDKANAFFDQMPEKNVVSWTTMVNGFSQNGDNEKALSVFSRMLEEDVRPNDFTVVSALSACAKIGALEAGLRIHKYITDNLFRLNAAIGTALVDMYAKCGDIDSASQVFNDTKERDILTWSVMIWGWALHGRFEQAALCFKQMLRSGIKPDEVVFLALLTACVHACKVDLGLNFFNSMRLDYRIEPSMKHYSLVVDLLGRAGRLNEALNFIQKMPVNPDLVIWGALFCACRAHKNIELAELSARKLLELEPKHPGSYVFLSNAYAAVGRWEDAERVRTLMLEKGVGKDPGWSYFELDGRVHRFVAGDNAHKDAKEIQLKLEEIMSGARQRGYTPGTEWVLHNIEEEEKEDALGSHSEKLALAFALIQTSPKTTIRIVKNLRICGDCHSLMKYTSFTTKREIIVRDIKRFHHFKDGTCSCGDYW